ncbi:hypothetical protein Q4F19_06490 [Sphingomonas sp. BIUV-7]|uniref:Uncharacterized protein n=1 Tax=Sphingomonas natans TaxID=3063330 RepID=A0ABT8Y6S6_9SPHN|nr:hypothetical protein [Sphingomonas sp. BIUV-7]
MTAPIEIGGVGVPERGDAPVASEEPPADLPVPRPRPPLPPRRGPRYIPRREPLPPLAPRPTGPDPNSPDEMDGLPGQEGTSAG